MKKIRTILILFALLTSVSFLRIVNVKADLPEADILKPETLPFVAWLWDPHNRPKNGPTLNNVTHKVNIDWLRKWIANPKGHDINARMPNLRLTEEEIEAVIAYLASIADNDFSQVSFDEFLTLPEGELDIFTKLTFNSFFYCT